MTDYVERTGRLSKKITIVIADDHPILRAGLRLLLNSQHDMCVIGEAETGDAAISLAREKRPDVLLLDLSMPGMGGVETTLEITKKQLRTRVLILTMHAGSAYVEAALAAGASGYVLKRSLDSELLSAIRNVQQGRIILDSSVIQEKSKPTEQKGPKQLVAKEAYDLLTRREHQS